MGQPSLITSDSRVRSIAAGIFQRQFAQARKTARRTMITGGEISRYAYAPDYNFEYQTLPPQTFFRAKAALTAEALKIITPELIQANPFRLCTTRSFASPQSQRIGQIVQDYLNYTPTITDLYGESRRAIDEALIYGRGVFCTDKDETTGLIRSRQVSVRNIILDGDTTKFSTARFVGERIVVNRFKLLQQYPQAKEQIMNLKKGAKPFPANDSTTGTNSYEAEFTSSEESVAYIKLYVKEGLLFMQGGDQLAKIANETKPPANGPAPEAPDNSPKVYCCSEDGEPFSVEDWDVPFFQENEFPYSFMDFYDNPSSIWSVSPLEAGLGYQKAINWIVTLLMGKYRFTSRTLLATIRQNENGLEQRDKDKLLIGNDIESIEVNVKGEQKKLGDFIQQFDWKNDYMTVGMAFLDKMMELYQKATGVYDILYGLSQTQDRSAAESQIKDRNSRSRLDDMKDRVVKCQSVLARKEAQAIRFLNSSQDMARVVGQQDAQDWGFLVKPDGQVVQQMLQQYIQSGMPPQQAVQQVQQAMAQAVDMDRWKLETDYSIEAGSIRRKDIDQRIDSYKELMASVVPQQMGSEDPNDKALAYQTMAGYLDSIQADPDEVRLYRQRAQQLLQQAQMMMQQQMQGQPGQPHPGGPPGQQPAPQQRPQPQGAR